MEALEKKKLENRLNLAIEEMGLGYGPSLVNLLLYGPFGVRRNEDQKYLSLDISSENEYLLKKREENIKNSYNTMIHNLDNVVSTLTGGEGNFPKGDRIRSFRIRPYEEIRNLLRDNIKGQFALNKETRKELFSKDSMNVENNSVRFYHDKGNGGFLYALRTKSDESCWNKYNIIWEKFSNEERDRFLHFLVDVAEDEFFFWENRNFANYRREYGCRVTDMMLKDIVAFRITDLDYERGEDRKKWILSKGDVINMRGFEVIKGLVKDHSDRSKYDRPAGVHLTLRDKGLMNFPMEVQSFSIRDHIYDLTGPNKHGLYTTKGKKKSYN